MITSGTESLVYIGDTMHALGDLGAAAGLDDRLRRRRARRRQASRKILIESSAMAGRRIYAVRSFPGLGKFEKQGEVRVGRGVVRTPSALSGDA